MPNEKYYTGDVEITIKYHNVCVGAESLEEAKKFVRSTFFEEPELIKKIADESEVCNVTFDVTHESYLDDEYNEYPVEEDGSLMLDESKDCNEATDGYENSDYSTFQKKKDEKCEIGDEDCLKEAAKAARLDANKLAEKFIAKKSYTTKKN